MSFTIGYEGDWLTRLRDKVYEQFKGLPNIDAVVQAIAKQAQDLEESGQLLLLLLSIDDCTGAQLRMLGQRVGQPYAGESDDIFRLYLRARIAANRSDGSPEALYTVFRAMLGAVAILEIRRSPIKSFELFVHAPPMADDVAAVALGFLTDAKELADRGLLYWQGDVDAEMFTLAFACYGTGAAAAGDANMDVDDASAFPNTGTVIIDEGTADEETVAFDSHTLTSMHFPAQLANSHGPGCTVALVGATGKGFASVTTEVNLAAVPTDSAFDVVDSTGFAANDVIVVDEGTVSEETFTVTGVIIGAISVTPAIAIAHATNAIIVKVGSGGQLEAVAQA